MGFPGNRSSDVAVMKILLFFTLLVMVGCTTAPDMQYGWKDSFVHIGGGIIIDGECLPDADYDALEKVCPECVEKRADERAPTVPPFLLYDPSGKEEDDPTYY